MELGHVRVPACIGFFVDTHHSISSFDGSLGSIESSGHISVKFEIRLYRTTGVMSWGIVDGSPEACFTSVVGHR